MSMHKGLSPTKQLSVHLVKCGGRIQMAMLLNGYKNLPN